MYFLDLSVRKVVKEKGERIELSIDELVSLVSEKRAVALYFNSLVPRIFHISESYW